MSGAFGTFTAKEGRETLKTWRLWVLPGILLFLALSSPLLTKLTPELIKATASSQPGVVIKLPPPTARDSYVQYMGNLSQLVMIAIIIAGAAIIASERKAGTAVLVLTKPISRAGFVVAKAISQLTLLIVAAAAGAAVCIATTVALFGNASISQFIEAVALWLVFACAMLMLMLWLSAAMSGQAPAAGAGVAIWIALFVLTGFPLIRDHSPAGLISASDAALRGRDVALLWPVVTTVVAGAACLAGAVWAFRRKEL
jgi:ABC-2 type transport system permease protein